MILTRIDMERSAREVRAALSDCQKMHRLLMGLFGTGRKDSSVLYRIREQGMTVSVYIYSDCPPMEENVPPCMHVAGTRDLSEWVERFDVGETVSFSLLTMPFKKVAGDGRNSQRRVLRSAEERRAWLERKAEQNGFSLLAVQELPAAALSGSHPEEKGGRLVLDPYEYRGVLQITDRDRFLNALCRGLGAGKAYGLGMILIG